MKKTISVIIALTIFVTCSLSLCMKATKKRRQRKKSSKVCCGANKKTLREYVDHRQKRSKAPFLLQCLSARAIGGVQ